mgnify:CR=1 FL=1|tara:strand:- start:4509 stop:4784 length:276 start_codon:yes stop_codon:yes gene_type:complete
MTEVNIIAEKCDPKAADNKKLPYTAYLITYKVEGKVTYDIAICQREVDLFDHYYDKYKKDFVGFRQSAGIANPKLWNNKQLPPPEKPQKKK